jgi:hypothetical protein
MEQAGIVALGIGLGILIAWVERIVTRSVTRPGFQDHEGQH